MKSALSVLAWLLSGSIFFSASSVYPIYDSKGKRDPFVPLVTEDGRRFHPPGLDEEESAAGSSHRVVLQGVVFDPLAESYAIINGEIVREHEKIGGVEVLKIEPNSVTIWADGEPQVLTVRENEEGTRDNP